MLYAPKEHFCKERSFYWLTFYSQNLLEFHILFLIQKSHQTIKSLLGQLQLTYHCFKLKPHTEFLIIPPKCPSFPGLKRSYLFFYTSSFTFDHAQILPTYYFLNLSVLPEQFLNLFLSTLTISLTEHPLNQVLYQALHMQISLKRLVL